jgi:hypothetical protein
MAGHLGEVHIRTIHREDGKNSNSRFKIIGHRELLIIGLHRNQLQNYQTFLGDFQLATTIMVD